MTSPDLPDLLDAVVIQTGAATAAIAARDVERFVLLRVPLRIPLAPAAVDGVAVVGGAPALVIDVSAALATAQAAGRDGPPPPAPHRPARFAIVCRAEGETVVLVGAQVRSACRLRTVTRAGAVSAEWRGAAIPLLDVRALVAAAVHAPDRPRPGGPSRELP